MFTIKRLDMTFESPFPVLSCGDPVSAVTTRLQMRLRQTTHHPQNSHAHRPCDPGLGNGRTSYDLRRQARRTRLSTQRRPLANGQIILVSFCTDFILTVRVPADRNLTKRVSRSNCSALQYTCSYHLPVTSTNMEG